MNKTDIYVKVNNGTLCLYKTQGLLKYPNTSIKITKEIACILSYCCLGLSLNNAIKKYFAEDSNVNLYKLTLGIAALIQEDKLLAKEKSWDIKNKIVNEEDIFYPQSMHIELTTRCNLNCFYCYRKSNIHSEDKNKLSLSELQQIIKSLSEKGLQIVELTGGEPLLYPDILKVIEICYEHLALISIISNATLVNTSFIDKILPFKDKIFFSISLDSFISKEHDRRCGVTGAFEKATNGIKLLAENGIIVRVAMAVDEDNWNQIEETLLLSKSLGAAKFTYSPILPFGRATTSGLSWNTLKYEDVKKMELLLHDKYYDFLHHLPEKENQSLYEQVNCGAGHRNYVMSPSGIVRLCATFDENEGVIGNLSAKSPYEIFQNELCFFSSRVPPPTSEKCGNCIYLGFCQGCALRGLKKAEYIGIENCFWAKDNNVKRWIQTLKQSSF
jgi:radical SAM protein with 4Fe4S-binding SPASM domain